MTPELSAAPLLARTVVLSLSAPVAEAVESLYEAEPETLERVLRSLLLRAEVVQVLARSAIVAERMRTA